MKTVKVKLKVRKNRLGAAPGPWYLIVSINGALTVPGIGIKDGASPGDWIDAKAAQALVDNSRRYDVTVVPDED
jgi:proteasome assembly chaperone (PAC2) family protein